MRILLVEDDDRIALPLKIKLEREEHSVLVVNDGQKALKIASQQSFDLILLDVMLPGLDGISVCKRLRHDEYEAFIVMLTAKDKSSDKILGLNCGADDYIAKPFDVDELCARVQALSRRSPSMLKSVLVWGELLVDQNSYSVSYKGVQVRLTATEYRMLVLLMKNPGRIFSKEAFLSYLWTDDKIGGEIIKAHIKALRNKLERAGVNRDVIETIYGVGYRLKKL